MPEHLPWKGITAFSDPHLREVQAAYVDGYIMALEDVLHEATRLQALQTAHVAREEPSWTVIVSTMYRPLRKYLGKTLEQARQTLKHLKERDERQETGTA